MKKFAVCLCFGGSPPACSDYQVYKFSTAEELNAFLKGVDAAIGWLEAFQIDPGDECPICNNGTVEFSEDEEFVCMGECGSILCHLDKHELIRLKLLNPGAGS